MATGDPPRAEIELERSSGASVVVRPLISDCLGGAAQQRRRPHAGSEQDGGADRKSTRLNSSHVAISYAVFCLKKKKRNDHKRDDDTEQCHVVTRVTRS